LGQIDNKTSARLVSSKKSTEYIEVTDEILDTLNEEQIPLETQGVDISLGNVHNQIQSMEKEIESNKFSRPAKLSSSKEYSNEIFENPPNINELRDDEIYNLPNNDGNRKIEILKELKINLGNLEL
jgi:hypothetical protein